MQGIPIPRLLCVGYTQYYMVLINEAMGSQVQTKTEEEQTLPSPTWSQLIALA